MSIIKAGTYRWNDVLTQPPYDVGGQTVSVNLTVSTAIDSATAQAIKKQLEAEGFQADFVVQDYSFVCAYSALRVYVHNDENYAYFILSYETPNVSFEPYDPVVEQIAPALLFGGSEAYHLQFGWGHPWYQTITIPYDQDVSDEFELWFTANTVEPKIIKAGTYRFNEWLSPPAATIEQSVAFTCKAVVAGVGTLDCVCTGISVEYSNGNAYGTPTVGFIVYGITPDVGYPPGASFKVYWSEDGAWNTQYGGDVLQTITIPYDQYVSDEFYEWFAVNAKVYTTISGTWIIKDIPSFDNELLECVNFISNGKTYLAFLLHMGSTESEIFYAYSESGTDQAYIDWCYDSEGNEVLYVWSNNAYKTIEFVGEQSVSQQFVDWLTANATRLGIDFSTLKSLTILEGVVTQIADANGNVVWYRPNAHQHIFGAWVTITPATCTTDGLARRTCSGDGCGHYEEQTIPATGHKHGEPVLTREPTCTKPAEYAVYCTVCNTEVDRYEDDGEFAEHIPDGGKVTKEATCDTAGEYTYYCRECGTWVKTDIIPAFGHTWGSPYYSSEFSSGYGQKCATCGELQELAYVECDHPESAYHESIITSPSCTTTGSKTCSCDVCNQSWSVSIPALEHSYTSSVTAPTCTAKGFTKYICSRCNHTYTDNETAALGHKSGNPVCVREATCTVAPEYAVYCTVCGVELDRYEDDGGLLEHVADGGRVTTQPTCMATGIRKYYCRECSTWIRDEVVPATGHSYTSKVTAPTCTAKGYTTHTCSKCGHSYTDTETAALGHNGGTPVRVREATCTVPAQYAVYCTRCSVEIDRYENDGEFAEHTPNEGVVTTNPTCVATGIRKYHCSKCSTWIKDETVAATGIHTYSSVVTEPTCTDGGYTTHTCTVCGHSYTDNETDPDGHSWGVNGGWVTDVAATCTRGGTEKHTCSSCGKVETRATEPLGHNYEYDYTEDATCESGGYDVYTCTRCGDWYMANETEPNGHDFSDGWVTEKEATCEETGTERKTCATCGYYEERDIPLADHDYEAIEDSSQSSGYIGVCRVCGHVEEDHAP